MDQNQLKQAVAQSALDYTLSKITSDSMIGIGTGSTANFFIDALAQYKSCFKATVASSKASSERLKSHGIEVLDLNAVEQLSIYIDGADETNPSLHLIKGGGAALTREKIIAAAADEFVCIADQSKWVECLGAFPLPVEVIPMARNYVARELKKLGARPVYREGVVTDNGNHILDLHDFMIVDARKTEQQINQIVGVVTNGLFAHRPADVLLLATDDGVKTFTAS